MSSLKQVYLEHQNIITQKIPAIKHVDLWAEQVSFLSEEHRFKSPAIFLAYRILRVEDQGLKSQTLRMGVDIKFYYETFLDTNRDSKKQNKALTFLDVNDEIFKAFHALSGEHFSEMRRVGLSPIETGSSGILWEQKFEFVMVDDAAFVHLEGTGVKNVIIEKGSSPETPPENYIFEPIETS